MALLKAKNQFRAYVVALRRFSLFSAEKLLQTTRMGGCVLHTHSEETEAGFPCLFDGLGVFAEIPFPEGHVEVCHALGARATLESRSKGYDRLHPLFFGRAFPKSEQFLDVRASEAFRFHCTAYVDLKHVLVAEVEDRRLD